MNYYSLKENTIPSGFSYLTQGAGILLTSGMKRFVFIPILANCIVFVLFTFWLFAQFTSIQEYFLSLLPEWSWLSYIVAFFSGLFIFFMLLVYGYSFTVLTNIIAAPFYGRLAEKIEERISGQKVPAESILSMVFRTLRREMIKLFYFITRGILVFIGLFLLSFIPLINLLVPLLALLWGTWVMTLQYIDYPADNNQLPFTSLRNRLKAQRYSSVGFGGTIMFCSMIPIVNIFIMPIAVAGGTLFWINELQQDYIDGKLEH